MRVAQGAKTVLGVGLLVVGAGFVQAQEKFVASGPVDVFVDLATAQRFLDYSWVATVTYDPSAPDVEIYTRTRYDQSFIYGSIQTIEYAIYDAHGALVASGVETGAVGNVASAVNDKDSSDSIHDQVFWYADNPGSTRRTQASIGFMDASGTMVSTVSEYPKPPAPGEFTYGGSTFYQFNPSNAEGFEAHGRVSDVSTHDPILACLEQASNHGQYVSCATRVLNELRKSGDISGQEKGQWTSTIATLKAIREGSEQARQQPSEGLLLSTDAVQQSCGCGGDHDDDEEPLTGRMTGGGSVFAAGDIRVTHGFQLRCDVGDPRQNLEINWDSGNRFHLTSLDYVSCTNDPAIDPGQPESVFDTYTAVGAGLCNGVAGASISFTFKDAGEPGLDDFAEIVTEGCPAGVDITVSGLLEHGNHQAHRDQ